MTDNINWLWISEQAENHTLIFDQKMIAALAGDPRRAAEAEAQIRGSKDPSRLSFYPLSRKTKKKLERPDATVNFRLLSHAET